MDDYTTTSSATTLPTPTESTKSASSDTSPVNVSAIIGSLSSVAAVAFCILLAWILVRRKRTLEKRGKDKLEAEEAANLAWTEAQAYSAYSEANSTAIHEAPDVRRVMELCGHDLVERGHAVELGVAGQRRLVEEDGTAQDGGLGSGSEDSKRGLRDSVHPLGLAELPG
jgi:hypothetical protein